MNAAENSVNFLTRIKVKMKTYTSENKKLLWNVLRNIYHPHHKIFTIGEFSNCKYHIRFGCLCYGITFFTLPGGNYIGSFDIHNYSQTGEIKFSVVSVPGDFQMEIKKVIYTFL